MAKHKKAEKAWRKWRKRALAAEASRDAVTHLFLEETGMTVSTYMLWKTSELFAARPHSGVYITNLEVPIAS